MFKHYPLNFYKDGCLRSPLWLESRVGFGSTRYPFENQKALQGQTEMYAEQIGLDMDKWRVDKERQSLKDLVSRDMREGSKAGVRGTPSVFINGRRYQPTGGFTVEGFKAAIDKEILKK